MNPLIPFEFDPGASNYYDAHLMWHDEAKGRSASWPLIGAKLMLPSAPESMTLDELEAANSDFKAHGFQGFSLGGYHEFIMSLGTEARGGFKFGSIECTFGQATPLAALAFEGHHRSKWFGTWEEISSLRIYAVGAEDLEQVFISACAAFERKFGHLPVFYPIDEGMLFWDELDDDTPEPELQVSPPIVTNLDPMRFYYNGLSQADDAAACVSYYRVLEHFSFLAHAAEMKKLRHDGSVSDADFSKRVLDLVSKDEKGPIFKLITALADSKMITSAQADGLVGNAAPNTFAEALYAFRNSIVHGKFSYGYALQSSSVIGEDATLPKWKTILRALAEAALDKHGTRKV